MLVGSTAAVAVNDGANSVQPVLVGSTAASQLTTEPIATGVGGVNRRGRRSRHERSVLVGSTTSDGANNDALVDGANHVLVGSNAVVDGADNEQSVLVGSTAAAVAVTTEPTCWWGRMLCSTEPTTIGVGGVDCCCRS